MQMPICHFTLEDKDNSRDLCYFYGDEPYLRLRFDTAGKVFYKRGSDADIQSDPPIHQLVFETEENAAVRVDFMLRDGMVLRPRRAQEGEAILSQYGKPLIYGVNGLYDLETDIFLFWSCCNWSYEGAAVTRIDGRDWVTVQAALTPEQALTITVLQQYYRRHMGYSGHNPQARRYDTKTISGWATWEAFHSDVSLESLQESVRFLKDNLRDYGLEYIQLDDGYQSTLMPPDGVSSIREGWLATNDKFPGGHSAIVETVRSAGFEAAIWLNATINNREYARQSGHCLRKRDGTLFEEPWIHFVYSCTGDAVKDIEKLYRTLAQTGYSYFKVDAIRHLFFDGLQSAVREGLFSNDESIARFQAYMQAIRNGIGDESYLLSCWGVLTANVGICDSLRFATDASASHDSFFMQVDESARWHHTHGILYRNDPDYICLRMEEAPARAAASLVTLNGYLYMISDEVSLYDDVRLDIARKTLPATDAVTAETGAPCLLPPMNYTGTMAAAHEGIAPLAFGSLWVTHYVHGDRRWATVNLLRPSLKPWTGGPAEISVAALGLDPSQSCMAFDFWAQKPLGIVKDILTLEIPAPLDCRVIALTPISEHVELIGSSRHISMDVVGVTTSRQESGGMRLALRGIPGSQASYWLYVPSPVRCTCSAEREGLISTAEKDGILRVDVTFAGESMTVIVDVDGI